jgi:hypothetical protein
MASQGSGWKGQLNVYDEDAAESKDLTTLREATLEKTDGRLRNEDASHTFLISKDDVVVAGCYLQLTDYQCFVISHTSLYNSNIDYEQYLVTHLYKHHRTNDKGLPRVFGLFRVNAKFQPDSQDAGDKWLECQMTIKFRREYYHKIDTRISKIVKTNKELQNLHNDTGIQQMWVGEYVTFNYYIPVESGFQRPARKLNGGEIGDINTKVKSVRHKQAADKYIADCEHFVLYYTHTINKMRITRESLPDAADIAAKSPSSGRKAKPKPPKRRRRVVEEDDKDDDDDDGDDDDDADDGDDDEDDDGDGDNDGGDGGYNAIQSNTQDMMDDDSILMSDEEPAVESHHPPKKLDEKKEFEKFLAMKRKKELRKKRRAKFDDDDRSE